MIDWGLLVAQKGVGTVSDRLIVYGLVDPRTLLVRYVGRSASGMSRPKQHSKRSARETNYKASWIRSLHNEGLEYTIVVLERYDDRALLVEGECWWIAFGRACAWPLTNLTDGGEGDRNATRMHTAECREKISAALRGRKLPRAQVEASARGHIGLRPSAETLAKLRGRKQTPEHIARRAASRRGTPCSPETRAKISASLRARGAK